MCADGRSPHVAATHLVSQTASESRPALISLTPLVYAEMRAMAATFLRRERAGHTLRPTDLVHEAYVRMAERGAQCPTEVQFRAVAAIAMRNVLVDHARRRRARKRSVAGHRVSLTWADSETIDGDQRLLELHELMNELCGLDARLGQVVELRVFGGMTHDQVAEVLGISRTTAADDWSVARAWLAVRLKREDLPRRKLEAGT